MGFIAADRSFSAETSPRARKRHAGDRPSLHVDMMEQRQEKELGEFALSVIPITSTPDKRHSFQLISRN
jgi:hypothetical protein